MSNIPVEFQTPLYPLTEDGVLKVYGIGETTLLGFGGENVPSDFDVIHYKESIIDLLKTNSSKTVAFDLSGVTMVPSGLLGLLVSLRDIEDLNPVVQVFNPSADVEEVLQISKLNTIIEVH